MLIGVCSVVLVCRRDDRSHSVGTCWDGWMSDECTSSTTGDVCWCKNITSRGGADCRDGPSRVLLTYCRLCCGVPPPCVICAVAIILFAVAIAVVAITSMVLSVELLLRSVIDGAACYYRHGFRCQDEPRVL